ncbi:MAG: acetamidase/formamidase family protein, partial [Clostridia bacterium]|nr:acetamidase/formamidase family protein [Clostridia bacterium]
MLRIEDTHVTDRMDASVLPVARCKSGDTVVFVTRDCYDNAVTSPERPCGDRTDTLANPATGPLFVEGAEEGDVLKVEILKIDLRSWGVMRSSPTAGAFPYLYEKREARIFDLSRGQVEFDEVLTEPVDTMIGVIGTAPAGEGIDTETPDSHGGNMDCNRIVEGSTLYLPVNTPGALLAMGDLHARMGDGEVFICG